LYQFYTAGVVEVSYIKHEARNELYWSVPSRHWITSLSVRLYSASHSRGAPENVGLQKEQKYNTFACYTCNEVRLCVLGIHIKEVGNTKR
jgi:hypothetical protein